MTTPALVTEVKQMMKSEPDWLQKMTSPQLNILAKINPDICETTEEYEPGRKRTIVKPEFRNRYTLYAALRKKHRCPRDRAADAIIKNL